MNFDQRYPVPTFHSLSHVTIRHEASQTANKNPISIPNAFYDVQQKPISTPRPMSDTYLPLVTRLCRPAVHPTGSLALPNETRPAPLKPRVIESHVRIG